MRGEHLGGGFGRGGDVGFVELGRESEESLGCEGRDELVCDVFEEGICI